MNDEISKRLFENGAFCILLDVPVGTEFGIDWNTWTTDTQFKGLKLIPPGIHYIHYSVKGVDLSPQSGFLHSFGQREVFVRRWNKSSGLFELVDSLVNENIRSEQNLKSLDPSMAPYPYDSYKRWCGLSNNITSTDLTRLVPECGFIDAIVDYEAKVDDRNRCTETDKEGLPVLTVRPQSKIGYVECDRQKWWPLDCSARERTSHAQDSSWFVSSLVDQLTLNGLLADFQFAYITFVVGQVMSSFDQWKQMLRVFCFCKSIHLHETLYTKLFSALYFQMQTIPTDFMVDIVSSDNVVLHCLNQLFKNIFEERSEIRDELRQRAGRFRSFCEKQFDWTFYQDGEESEEDEDDAPMVVIVEPIYIDNS